MLRVLILLAGAAVAAAAGAEQPAGAAQSPGGAQPAGAAQPPGTAQSTGGTAQPDAAALEKARSQAREALRQAGELARQPGFVRQALEARGRATAAAAAAASAQPGGLASGAFPQPDAETLRKARADLERLLSEPDRPMRPATARPAGPPPPIILVSLSMPEASLRGLMREAARIGAPLVLRGPVEGGLKETMRRILRLADADGDGKPDAPQAGLAIDPTLFERFDVRAAPTFVLTAKHVPPCSPDGCPTPPHVRAAGDVTLAYALEVFSRQADDPALRRIAAHWLQALRQEAAP